MVQNVSESPGIEWLKEIAPTIFHYREFSIPGYLEGESPQEINRKLSTGEIERILSIVEQENLILYPTSSFARFSPAFDVLKGNIPQLGMPAEIKRLLFFTEQQLPKEYTFKRLSDIFLSHHNLELIKFYGLDPTDLSADRSRYEN